MHKSKAEIKIFKAQNAQVPLSYVALGHRRLEKELPTPKEISSATVVFAVPVDLLRVAGYPASLVDGIEGVELEYRRKVPATL